MFSFNAKKLFFLLSLLILNFTGITYCSYQPDNFNFKYPALKQPKNKSLSHKREKFHFYDVVDTKNTVNIFPLNKVIYVYPKNVRSGTCYNDAIHRTLNLSDEQFGELTLSMVSCEDWYEIIKIPYDFFDQIKKPQLNCLATYTQGKNDFDILHMATVTHNNRLISKGGTTNAIIEHGPWDVPAGYGNKMRFWKLKEEYSGNENNKNLLFITLRYKIQTSLDMKKLLYLYNQELLISTDYLFINRIVQGVMGLNLDVRNEHGETPSIVAARKKRYDIIYHYLNHGANINIQDNGGKTLLMIAIKQNHQEFVRLLLRYKASPYIKNNKNQDAFTYAAQYNNQEILAALLGYHIFLSKSY